MEEADIYVKDLFRAQGLPEEAAQMWLVIVGRASNTRRWLITDMSSGLLSPMRLPSVSRRSSSECLELGDL